MGIALAVERSERQRHWFRSPSMRHSQLLSSDDRWDVKIALRNGRSIGGRDVQRILRPAVRRCHHQPLQTWLNPVKVVSALIVGYSVPHDILALI